MIAILQPIVPHYRKDFFNGLEKHIDMDIYQYDKKAVRENKFSKSNISTKPINSISTGPVLLYNPFTLLKSKYTHLVLPLHIGHITTWFLLITQCIHHKKIILWGHGISVKRYITEENNPSKLLKRMIKLSYGCWFYTVNELNIWRTEIPELNAVALSNTLSDIETRMEIKITNKDELKRKYNISQPKILIYCARFENPYRRSDLLIRAIETLNDKEFGFIIIGDGRFKPDFSCYKNVYDFKAEYDLKLKSELFAISDIYFQPAWLGLSIVEAMSFGKPVFTFKRTDKVKQCVEYAYLKNNENGLIFDNFKECVVAIEQTKDSELMRMGANASEFVKKNLTSRNMVSQALSLLNKTTINSPVASPEMSNTISKDKELGKDIDSISLKNNTAKIKILLLWAPLADYMVACLKELSLNENLELHIVYQFGDANAPYNPFDLSFCKTIIPYNSYTSRELFHICTNLKPHFIMMSSWNYPIYMLISRNCKKCGTYVLSMFDGQWTGSFKQVLGRMISFVFLKPSISNFFVPGDRQVLLSRNLGYKSPYMGYYSANTKGFSYEITERVLPKKFTFIGRIVANKGIDILVNAYKKYRIQAKEPWDLDIYGKGNLEYLFDGIEGVRVMEFQQPDKIPAVLVNSGCFILPSYYEPWGVVIHEAAMAGLPIIASYKAGAITYFVRDGQNGFIINPDEGSLLEAMLTISALSEKELTNMSVTSKKLGLLWTTEKWAEYVNRIIDRYFDLPKNN